MPKFHIHVYRVVSRLEVDVEAECERKAQEKALEKRNGPGFTKPDCSFIALAFNMDTQERADADTE